MAYKSIFTVLTEFAEPATMLAKAVEVTRDFDAHLDVMCLGMDRSRSNYYEVSANAMIFEAAIKETHAKAEKVRAGVESLLGKEDIRWNAVDALGNLTDAGRIVADAARFGDLTIAAQPYGEGASNDSVLLVEAQLFNAGRPTLVVPQDAPSGKAESVVVAWNESPQALRAIRSALPFLQAANAVHIAIIDPPEHAPDRSDPGGNLAVLLARHGVHCEIQVMSRSGARVSERLNRHVNEMGAGMLVMGAYGHSRFREAIIGGATREMLEHAKVPVLMAH
jgi:hypothetical protein